jgi:hypothetical protein
LTDVSQQVALRPCHGDEGQAVMPGLFFGQLPCARPLDAAEVRVRHEKATTRDTGLVSLLDHEIEHRLGVFAGRRVQTDPVVAGEVREHEPLQQKGRVDQSQQSSSRGRW